MLFSAEVLQLERVAHLFSIAGVENFSYFWHREESVCHIADVCGGSCAATLCHVCGAMHRACGG